MNRVVVAYAWGRANAGDLAISLGGLELMSECLQGHSVSVISRHTRGSELDSVPYLQDRFPTIRFVSSPFRSSGKKPLSKLLDYIHGMIVVGATLVWPRLTRVLLKKNEGLQVLFEADVILINGGNLLYWNQHRRAIGRIVALVFPALLARRLGKRYGFLPQSMGPFDPGLVSQVIGSILEGASFVLFREGRSREYASTIADLSKTVTAVVPDLAFFIKGNSRPAAQCRGTLAVSGSGDQRIVAVTLRASELGDPDVAPDHDEIERVARRVANIVAAVKRRHREIRVVAVQQTLVDEAVTMKFAERFRQLTGQGVPIQRELDPVALAAIYKRAHVLVGMRLHASILALAQRTPALGLYLERFGPKMPGTFEQLGMGRYSVNLDSISDDKAVERLEELLVNRDLIRHELDRVLTEGESELRYLLTRWVASESRQVGSLL